MFELKGKYGEAKIFTDVADQASISQVMNLLNQPFAAGSQIRMMPDIHAGAGCTIGTTMTVTDKIVPNLVGVDVGCGMEVAILREKEIDLAELDRVIHERIPAGFSKRTSVHRYIKNVRLDELHCKDHVNISNAELSLGTCGGGNHFCEANRDNDGNIYLVIHSGSRHLGLEVATYYQNLAWEQLCQRDPDSVNQLIARLKKEGRQKDIQKELAALKNASPKIPKELAYLTGTPMEHYLHDMKITQEFATWNRNAMMDEILKAMNLNLKDRFTTIHNYVDVENGILRKGAVSAKKGERLIIPINMRDGSLICIGKGNPDWNCSAPHGAGRLMSRSAAKEAFSVEEFREQMSGIYTTSVGASTLDETPMAYKDMKDIVDNIGPTAEILHIIKPIYNFKAGNED